ncbi:MAG TPA: HD domain-containing protein [Gemmataceae bacterium]|nr:HD domain-containing protein [Gemmataceae bacterium]
MGLVSAHERMANDKLRQAIALEAARLMYERVESEYYTAKRKAAKRLCRRGIKPENLPSNAEIRDQIQVFARIHEGEKRTLHLKDMRLEALRCMRLLAAFRPRLIGSVMTGHVRKGSDIDIHVFTDAVGLVTDVLEREGFQFDVERKQIVKHNEARIFTHIHVFDRFPFEITVYPEEKVHYVFKSSVTGKAIEQATIRELEDLIAREYPEIQLEEELEAPVTDPYPVFRMLLLPLEEVKQRALHYPEGDVLYHSLQVFDLARDAKPFDEDFLLAALLHDIGKGLDAADHVKAALNALDGLITDRTRFFIEHHMNAHHYRAGSLPGKLRKELEKAPDFEDLMLLRELDDAGRVRGAAVGTVDEALYYLKELERFNG